VWKEENIPVEGHILLLDGEVRRTVDCKMNWRMIHRYFLCILCVRDLEGWVVAGILSHGEILADGRVVGWLLHMQSMRMCDGMVGVELNNVDSLLLFLVSLPSYHLH
jgi:hypothetical protein